MEDYLLQGPPTYKRQRLDGESLQASGNFLDARANMVPFGIFATPDRDADLNITTMSMGGNLAINPVQDFNQLAVPDWRHALPHDIRNRFVHKLNQIFIQHARNQENTDSRSPKWISVARKIEGKAFKSATSRSHYCNILKEEVHQIKLGAYSYPGLSSQFLPSSSTTSATAANNLQLVNMQQNYGPNNFGEPVTATQSHSQPGIAHSATSVNLFSDEAIGGAMRIPVTSSIGSARPQFESFNNRQPGPRPMVHEQVPGSSIPIGDPSQFMPNTDQVLAPNLLHSMYLRTTPLSQFMPSSAVGSQQRFNLNDSGQGVLSENSNHMWHKSVTFNDRNRIIRKMAQILSTTPDPQATSLENKMHNCIAIATSVENETYRTANSIAHYYYLMAKRCHLIAKERVSGSQASVQYCNVPDIERMYEALGIGYSMLPLQFPANGGGSGGVNNGGGNGRSAQGNGDIQPIPIPPPGCSVPRLLGSAPGAPPHPYCAFGRAQSVVIQANHNQLLGTTEFIDLTGNSDIPQISDECNELFVVNPLTNRFLHGPVPLSLDGSDVPDVIKHLAHAYKCQERENQENDVMLLCSLPHCRETKNLLNHVSTCQAGINCCGSTKEIVDHWNRCTLNECPICLPIRQAERNLNSTVATTSSLNNPINMPPAFMRRPHRGAVGNGGSGNSNYPLPSSSSLLSNQSSPSGRNERILPRASMWHSSYNSDNSWRSSNGGGADMPPMDGPGGGGGGRRIQPRFWLHNRNGGNRHERRAPYNNPWAAPEIIFVDNPRGHAPRGGGGSIFGPMGSAGRNPMDRLQPYGTPWRAPDILFVENVRPAHRQVQDSDEPIIIQPEEDATPTEPQQMMAIVKVVKTHGGRLEQKFRCSRRSCSASWPCLHRRLAASIQSHKTPIPG